MKQATPAFHKLAIALIGAFILPLSVVNAFVGLIPFPRTLLQFLAVFIVAIFCIGYGREWRKVPWAGIIVRLIAYSPIIAPILLIVAMQIPVQPLGRHDARRDLAKGVYKVTIGHQPWSEEASRVLAERYGIISTICVGCIFTTYDYTYRAGYASIVNPALYEKYSRDVVTETVEEARANWRTNYQSHPLPTSSPRPTPDPITSGS